MAIVVLFRLAIVLTPTAYRIVNQAQPGTGAAAWLAIRQFWDALHDPASDDTELSGAMSESSDSDLFVTTWTVEVDMRKLQVRYSRFPAGGTTEDVAVTTHTFLKVVSGTPTGTWTDPGDFTTVENAFGTFWGAVKSLYQPTVHLDQYRWYIENSAVRLPNHSPNPAVRVTEVDVVGTGSGTNLPPQTAVSVTEKTAVRLSWGRFYMPSPCATAAGSNGRIASPTTWGAAAEAFYNTCRAANLIPVVFAPALPARSSAAAKRIAAITGEPPATDIAARVAHIYEVMQLQVDDTFDVIRSRRWDQPTVRDLRTLV